MTKSLEGVEMSLVNILPTWAIGNTSCCKKLSVLLNAISVSQNTLVYNFVKISVDVVPTNVIDVTVELIPLNVVSSSYKIFEKDFYPCILSFS
jgi:hypothetical protein